MQELFHHLLKKRNPMKIVKVKNTDTNLEIPAELRIYTPEQVVVLIKEFETAKLIQDRDALVFQKDHDAIVFNEENLMSFAENCETAVNNKLSPPPAPDAPEE